MSRASVLCALALFLGCVSLGCATGPESTEVEHKRKSARPAKPVVPIAVKASPSDGGAGDRVALAAAASPDARPAFDPNKGIEMKEVSEKKWFANMRDKLSERLKIDRNELHFSPAQQQVAFVRGPPVVVGKKAPKRPARYQIEVVDLEGKRKALFRPVTVQGSTEAPKDFHFLGEDRVVYEVVLPPPSPAVLKKRMVAQQKARQKAKRGANAAKVAVKEPPRPVTGPPPPPQRLFVVQPVAKRAKAIRCQGVHFTFTPHQDHFAFVGGQPDASFVSVDGTQVYPRRGRSIIATPPAWSKDGRALAFLETPPSTPARLILLAEFDNPSGDTTWDLPANAAVDGAHVFWAGTGKLVVGKTQMRPVFATSFERMPAPAPYDRSP